jgi:hypothetical protein
MVNKKPEPRQSHSKPEPSRPGGPGGIGGPGLPGGPGGPISPIGGDGKIFEKKVLDSLARIEAALAQQSQALAQQGQALVTINNKLDTLTKMVEDCCAEKPPPQLPTGVEIRQVA